MPRKAVIKLQVTSADGDVTQEPATHEITVVVHYREPELASDFCHTLVDECGPTIHHDCVVAGCPVCQIPAEPPREVAQLIQRNKRNAQDRGQRVLLLRHIKTDKFPTFGIF